MPEIEDRLNLQVAERDELRAVIEHQKTLFLWERTIGIGLERVHIDLQDAEPRRAR